VWVGRAIDQLCTGHKGADSLARNINDYCESPAVTCLGHEFRSDEFGDWLREVDTVDKDINIDDLLEWSALGSLLHIPLDNVVPTSVSLVS